MAELAGLRLRDRWAGWRGEPFTSESREPRLGLGEAEIARACAAPSLRQLPTAELTAAELAGLREIFAAAWPDGGFTDDDFAHGMGGMHWVAEVDGSIVSHASVVPRRLEAGDGRAADRVPGGRGDDAGVRAPRLRLDGGSRGGRVPASAVRARRALDERAGVLHAPRLGGMARADLGPDAAGDLERTEDDDGGIFILRTPSTPPLSLTDPLVCDWRSGDVW